MRHKSAPVRQAPSPSATRSPRSSALRIQIDHVTIESAHPAAQNRFESSLRAELVRLVSHQPGSALAGVKTDRIDQMDAGQLPADASPETIARRVAREIFAKLTPISGGMRDA